MPILVVGRMWIPIWLQLNRHPLNKRGWKLYKRIWYLPQQLQRPQICRKKCNFLGSKLDFTTCWPFFGWNWVEPFWKLILKRSQMLFSALCGNIGNVGPHYLVLKQNNRLTQIDPPKKKYISKVSKSQKTPEKVREPQRQHFATKVCKSVKCIKIATCETSPAITPFHFFWLF